MRNSNLAGLVAIGLRLAAVTATAGISLTALAERAIAMATWQFDAALGQLVISLPKGVTPRYYLMAEPARIVLDLPNTEIGTMATEQSYSGAVRQIRVAQFQPGLARIVMELSPETVLAPGQVELKPMGGEGAVQRWTLRPLLAGGSINPVAGAGPSTAPSAAAVSAAPTPAASIPAAPIPAAPIPAASIPATLPPLEPGAIEIPVQASAQPAPQLAAQSASPTSLAAPSVAPIAAAAPVDFSTPSPASPPELPELEIPSGSAATLSLPSARQAGSAEVPRPVVSPLSPLSSGARSFPTPTADAVSVPALSTVVPGITPANPAPANPAPANPARSLIAQPAAPASVAFGQPIPVTPAAIAQPQRPAPSAQAAAAPQLGEAGSRTIQVIPFGQPLPQ